MATISGFRRQGGNHWFCSTSLPSDITLVVDDEKFNLHKFPLISRCGKIAQLVEKSQSTTAITFEVLQDFPGGADAFFAIVKFCYSGRVELTPKTIVILYCAADYLDMTDDYIEDNLLSISENYFHKQILRNWKDCIMALQSCEPVMQRADKLRIISKCLHALSVMVCTDPSLFGWPMKMYGTMQSPGGSILWNGIKTGAALPSTKSDWWFEDISNLNINLFSRLIRTMGVKKIRPENIARAIMYYCKKYLPGLDRRQGGLKGNLQNAVRLNMAPAAVHQRVLLESVVKLLPDIKGKSFCRFLVGLLRVAFILEVNHLCQDTLERRIGVQLELATLDSLLIPNYSDSDALYNTDCVERMIRHLVSSEPNLASISPSSFDFEMSPSSARLRRAAKLVDNYMAEVASDVNLKPAKIRFLAQALPECSRSLHDGLYRALDIYLKTHSWLSEKEREQLCTIIDFQRLSIDACAHASQNERLPLRIILQILFFEQMHLRTALAGRLHVLDAENAPSEMAGPINQLDGWVTAVRENQVLRVDMERMRSRVADLEQEFTRIKLEMKHVSKSRSYLSSPCFFARGLGCKLLPQPSDVPCGLVNNRADNPRASVEQGVHEVGPVELPSRNPLGTAGTRLS